MPRKSILDETKDKNYSVKKRTERQKAEPPRPIRCCAPPHPPFFTVRPADALRHMQSATQDTPYILALLQRTATVRPPNTLVPPRRFSAGVGIAEPWTKKQPGRLASPRPAKRSPAYLTALTIASNAFGSFIARSARTLRFKAIPLVLSLPINCE